MDIQERQFIKDPYIFRRIVENTFETTIIHSDYKVVYINDTGAKLLGVSKEQIIGADVLAIFQESSKEKIIERIRLGLEENVTGELIEETITTLNGQQVEVELFCQPFELNGKPAILSVLRDISVRKQTERNLNQLVNEVSTPVVPISRGISIIPLVGALNDEKAKYLLESLPEKVIKQRSVKYLIIDFSGIYNIDEIVVQFLTKMNAIMRLLGISPIITGIRPELARKSIGLGMDLHKLITLQSVEHALLYLENQMPRSSQRD